MLRFVKKNWCRCKILAKFVWSGKKENNQALCLCDLHLYYFCGRIYGAIFTLFLNICNLIMIHDKLSAKISKDVPKVSKRQIFASTRTDDWLLSLFFEFTLSTRGKRRQGWFACDFGFTTIALPFPPCQRVRFNWSFATLQQVPSDIFFQEEALLCETSKCISRIRWSF